MSRAALVSFALAVSSGMSVACGATTPGAGSSAPPKSAAARGAGAGRPSIAAVVREGDARGGVAVAVTTRGLATERGAAVGVALAALVEARLAAKGIGAATIIGGWDGWRMGTTVAGAGEVPKLVEAVREAMLEPVIAGEPALAAVSRKLGALARRPLVDPALADAAECTGEAFGSGTPEASPQELEAWRSAAHSAGRVAFATAGDTALADAMTEVLRSAPAWPAAGQPLGIPWPAEGPATVYDASGEVATGGARVVVTARTALPERAIAAAEVLGAPHGTLASRLAGLDTPAQLRSVVATAHADGGCLAATLDLAPRDLSSDAPARIATVAALARQELAVEIGDTEAPHDLGERIVRRALDPREAAERAAWWALAGAHAGPRDALALRLVVGVAAAKDGTAPAASLAGAVRSEIDRATLAWHAPVVEARSRVERGQGEMWLLLGSPCGTLPETDGDAGSGAVVASSAAAEASESGADAQVEAFVAADGVGVLAHGPARRGESADAQARRLADLAARSFAAQTLRRAPVRRAQARLLVGASRTDSRALAALASALAPGHPSWVVPEGTGFGLGSASDDAVALRASTLRAGPLRVAVLANTDASQGDAAVRAVDRWVARRPGEQRVCPEAPSLPSPRAETYAVTLAPGAMPQALLAFPLAPASIPAAAAEWLVASLAGPDGLLAHALGAGGGGAMLAQSWGAELLGAPRVPAIVIRVEAAEGTLDAAVAQTRALLDRLRQGALREEDRARAGQVVARAALASALDPRARAIALWRGAPPSTPELPSLDALRAFAASALREDSLIVVAARPPRPESEVRPTPSHDAKPASRPTGANR